MDEGQEPKALHDTETLLSVGVERGVREAQLTKGSSRGTDGFRWFIVLVIMDWDLCSEGWE
jgi:hypothetical protein